MHLGLPGSKNPWRDAGPSDGLGSLATLGTQFEAVHPRMGTSLWMAGHHTAHLGESGCCRVLATEKHPPGLELGLWASLCATGQGRASRILNLFFVFLLAKFIASWRAGGLFKGEKRPSEA